jgi:hypothetical protein
MQSRDSAETASEDAARTERNKKTADKEEGGAARHERRERRRRKSVANQELAANVVAGAVGVQWEQRMVVALGMPADLGWLLKYGMWLLGGLLFGRLLRAIP